MACGRSEGPSAVAAAAAASNVVVVGLVLAHAVSAQHYMDSVAGPFRIVPDHVERCPPETAGGVNYSWRFARDRHSIDLWYYWINASNPYLVDDRWNGEMNFASWSSRGGWKDNAYILRLPVLCRFLPTYVPKLWRRVMAATFNDPGRRCPFSPGFYEAKNVSTEGFSVKFLPAFYYGTWRITARALESTTGRTGVCAVLFGKTVPR